MLCKLESSFKAKRGSRVCRRCDYCLQNYGKPKACQKCKVKAAWDGQKIEKIGDQCLCFICSFREKRKSKVVETPQNGNKENDKKTSKSGTPRTPTNPIKSIMKNDSSKKRVQRADPTVINNLNKKTIKSKINNAGTEEGIAKIINQTEIAPIAEMVEEIEIDVHTTASLSQNVLVQKIKEMNFELAKRKKIIESRDLTISSLRGLLTSKLLEHERQKKLSEARLAERIGDFKSQMVIKDSELVVLHQFTSEIYFYIDFH